MTKPEIIALPGTGNIRFALTTINNGLTLDFSFDKSKGDNRKELVVVGKEKKNPKILHH